MALEKNNIPISIANGIDTKADPKQLQPGKFISLENAVFLKTGQIQKRNGFKQNTKVNGLPMACSTFRNELFLLNRSLGYSFSPDQSSSSVAAYGPFDIGNVTKNVGVPASVNSACAIDPVRNTALYAYEYYSPNFTSGVIEKKVTWSLHDLSSRSKIIQAVSSYTYGRNPQVVTNEGLDYYIVVFETTQSLTNAGSFTIGVLYEITTLGTTNWNAIGYSGTPVVGGRFVATGVGSGTGVAGVETLYCFCVPKDPAFFYSDKFFGIGTVYSGFGFTLSNTQYPKLIYSSGNTGADTAINYFPLSFASLPVSLPAPVVLSGTSCRVGATASSAALGGYNYDLIAMNDGSNIKTIVYDSTLSTVIYSLATAMTVGSGDLFNGVVASYLDGTSTPTWALFTTTTRGSSTLPDLPRIQAAATAGYGIAKAKYDYILGAAIAGPAFTVDPSYFEPTLNRRSYLPIKMIEQFTQAFISVYDGSYSSYLVNFWETRNSISIDGLPKTVCTKFLSLNTRMTFPYAGYPTNQYKHFPDYSYFSSGYYASGANFYALVADVSGNSYLYKFSKNDRPTFTEIGNNLFVSGGILRMFDGWTFAEHNFLHQPLQAQLVNPGTAGSIPPGTYFYQVTYEWRDAFGQVHISSPSDPYSIVLSSSSHRVTVTVATLKLTAKTTPVWIGVYRSNDGVLYYKIPGTGVDGSLYNDVNQTSLTFTDNNSQTFIASQELLYTVGGELNNACAPACTFVSTYKRRLVLVPSEDNNSFWYSKEIIPLTADTDSEPVNFANEFVLSVNEEDGKITGLLEMDDKLVIFKTSGISITAGNGPAPNGTNNDFMVPQRLATDTGCLYGRSIVLLPIGIMFQSPKGYYLLDRSLSVTYVGAPVEAYNTIECTSATLMYDRNEIWFALQDGKTIVYNYYFSTFSILPSLLGAGLDQQATIYKGLYVVTSQVLKVETPGVYQDVLGGGTASGYAMKVTTGWMSFANIQGFQRVYKLLLLGDYKSSHRLQVQAAVDFDDTIVQTSVITPTATPPYQARFFMTRQKCESVKFTIQDLAPVSGTWNEAYTLSNMALEVGVKKGLNKLPASKSAG